MDRTDLETVEEAGEETTGRGVGPRSSRLMLRTLVTTSTVVSAVTATAPMPTHACRRRHPGVGVRGPVSSHS